MALIKDDSENLLEDMGVNIIEDASNDSVDLPTKRVPVNAVLKSKDQNARKCQPTCSNLHLIRFNAVHDISHPFYLCIFVG